MFDLSYSREEVADFHPAFKIIGNRVLTSMSLDKKYEWLHHPSSAGVGVIPDFVLAERQTGRWILVVEIKRRPDVVNSERAQIQAKGYSEANAAKYRLNAPQYFAITNMEVSHLFALRGASPPRDCLIENMSFISGSFATTNSSQHELKFATDLSSLVEKSINGFVIFPNPAKDMVSIQMINKKNSTVWLQMFDITGKLLIVSEYADWPGHIRLDLSDFTNGIYMIRLNINHSVVTRKFSIIR